MRRLVGAALKRDEISDDESFLSLGLDSLTAVDLVKRLEKELRRPLPITLFFSSVLSESCRPSSTPPDRPAHPVQRAFQAQLCLYPEMAAYGYVRQTITGPLDPDLLYAERGAPGRPPP